MVADAGLWHVVTHLGHVTTGDLIPTKLYTFLNVAENLKHYKVGFLALENHTEVCEHESVRPT